VNYTNAGKREGLPKEPQYEEAINPEGQPAYRQQNKPKGPFRAIGSYAGFSGSVGPVGAGGLPRSGSAAKRMRSNCPVYRRQLGSIFQSGGEIVFWRAAYPLHPSQRDLDAADNHDGALDGRSIQIGIDHI
jgi:hypothetical protein